MSSKIQQQASTSRATSGESTFTIPNQIQPLLCAELVIGRGPGVGGVTLQSTNFPSMISRRHASIKFVSDTSQWVLKDLMSLNGVYVNKHLVPRDKSVPLKHGDLVTFGVDAEDNELRYIFTTTKNLPVLLRDCATHQTLKRPLQDEENIIPSKKQRQNSPVGANSHDSVPTPARATLVSNDDNTTQVIESTLSKTPHTNSQDVKSLKTKPPKTPLSSNGESSYGSPSTVSIDSLFDQVKQETSMEMEDVIFGKTPPLTPRAQTVLQGLNVSAAEICIQIAKDEAEMEKTKLTSKYKALKNQLAAKDRLLKHKLAAKDRLLKEKEEKGNPVVKAVEQEFVCAICQELFIRSYTLACSHSFCELCIKQWMKKQCSPECPVCRAKILQEPVHSLVIDNVITRLVSNLTPEQREMRKKLEQEYSEALGGKLIASSSVPVSVGSAAVPIMIEDDDGVDSDVLTLTDDEVYLNSPDTLSDSSSGSEVSGDEGEYYGGYGRCFRCGNRGHWARGCPF